MKLRVVLIVMLSAVLLLSGSGSGIEAAAKNQPIMHTPSIQWGEAAPVLSGGSLSPASGDESTLFEYRVTYTNSDNDPPENVQTVIDGTECNMTRDPAGDGDYTNGEDYVLELTGEQILNPPSNFSLIDVVGMGLSTFLFHLDGVPCPNMRPDIFRAGQWSAFDVMVYLDSIGYYDMVYHWDALADTFIIDSINGDTGPWWYRVMPHGGVTGDNGYEENGYRMDYYWFEARSNMRLEKVPQAEYDMRYNAFVQETASYNPNPDGSWVLPEFSMLYENGTTVYFYNVTVRPHNLRPDVFQDGLITSLDVILSMYEDGLLTSVKFGWCEWIAYFYVIGFFVEMINDEWNHDISGWAYKCGDKDYITELGKLYLVHLTMDCKLMLGTEYLQMAYLTLFYGEPMPSSEGPYVTNTIENHTYRFRASDQYYWGGTPETSQQAMLATGDIMTHQGPAIATTPDELSIGPIPAMIASIGAAGAVFISIRLRKNRD